MKVKKMQSYQAVDMALGVLTIELERVRNCAIVGELEA